jgi:transposase
VKCPEHGVRQVPVPWAEGSGRFTSLFERLAIDVLKETSTQGGAEILRLSWDEAWHILDRAVARGRARKEPQPIARIGIDEKAIAKGHEYLTLVYDIDRSCVDGIEEGRKKESLDAYFAGLTREQVEGIDAVAMDMWEPYILSVQEHVPGASEKIVHDRFHIMKHMVDAVNNVRKQEHRTLLKAEDETLKGTKNLWLYSRENVPPRHRTRFAALGAQDLATGRAWSIKENLRRLWDYVSPAWAAKHWKRWYCWATHSRLEPVIRTARMIKARLKNVLTYVRHRITNAVAEGLNSKIQTIKQMACGFRNKEHFKTAIYFRVLRRICGCGVGA